MTPPLFCDLLRDAVDADGLVFPDPELDAALHADAAAKGTGYGRMLALYAELGLIEEVLTPGGTVLVFSRPALNLIVALGPLRPVNDTPSRLRYRTARDHLEEARAAGRGANALRLLERRRARAVRAIVEAAEPLDG